jgi:hypothetical protein
MKEQKKKMDVRKTVGREEGSDRTKRELRTKRKQEGKNVNFIL